MRRFKIGIADFAVVCILSVALTGCGTLGKNRPSDESAVPENISLSAARQLKFEDIPVPSGFKIIAKESYVFHNDYLRVGLLKYSGRAKGDQITKFYKEQMPLYNWETVNIIEHGTILLNFEKADESCIITVDSTFGSSSITIALSPRTKG